MNVPDKFCVAGDHGKWGAELMGDIGDDFLSKNIGAGGKSFSASRSNVCLIAKIGFVKYSEFPAVAGHRPEDRKAEEIC